MLREKTTNGGLTGMDVARSAGLQQAHISNFMNGKRGLSLEAMDRVLGALRLSVLDLLNPREINERASIPSSRETEFENVALVEAWVAASAPRITREMASGILKFRNSFLRRLRPACEGARRDWHRFVGLEVEAREGMSMFPRLVPGATILVDRHYTLPKPYRRGECSMFLVRTQRGCRVRYVEMASSCVVLRPHNHAYPVEMLEVTGEVSRHIVGRVAYVGIET